MITKLQLEDAIKTKKLVENRVLEVAKFCLKLESDLYGKDKPHVFVRSYHINKYHDGREPGCNVIVQFTNWDSHPLNEDEPENTNIERYIHFPERYLYTDCWQQERIDHVEFVKATLANSRIADMEKRLAEMIENDRKKAEEFAAKIKRDHALIAKYKDRLS